MPNKNYLLVATNRAGLNYHRKFHFAELYPKSS